VHTNVVKILDCSVETKSSCKKYQDENSKFKPNPKTNLGILFDNLSRGMGGQ
jgi:hypothetical protein